MTPLTPPKLSKYVFRVWIAAFILWSLLLATYNLQAQCEYISAGEQFTYFGCLDGEQPEYLFNCNNYQIEAYTIIQFTVPFGAIETHVMVGDPSLSYSHTATDSFCDFAISDDCNNLIFATSTNCLTFEELPPRDEPYNVVLYLEEGIYFLIVPTQGSSGSSTLSGCFEVTVFSMGFLSLNIREFDFVRNQSNRSAWDLLGRRIK